MYEYAPAATKVSKQPRYWLADQPPISPSNIDERKSSITILTLPRIAVPTEESVRTDWKSTTLYLRRVPSRRVGVAAPGESHGVVGRPASRSIKRGVRRLVRPVRGLPL